MEEEFSEYFYTNGNNQVVGPYSPDQILQLREQGAIFDDTLVCKNGDATWKPLERFLDTLVNEIRNQKAKAKAKALVSDTTLSSFENNDDEEEDDTETESTDGRTSFDIYKIVHLALLAVIAILLICQLFSKGSSLPMIDISPSNKEENNTSSKVELVPVAIQSSTTLPVSVDNKVEKYEYEYGAVHIDREDMSYAEERNKKNPKYGHYAPIELPYKLSIGGYEDWSYVGILCNDGINGSWILVRRKRAHK